eukprot:TRINITY_DN8688_c0_g1_i2.p1 TRINITY_DN8688_c0_g1~~TRINITY_DN8688_c0_g1_i2.p1  ORF type:complete len:224 (-),score=23.59 TRINITY_DN8688_c0_g1_i2:65-736(-)
MFLVVALTKNHILPWTRKIYHLRHHRESGLAGDIEERFLGLGLAWYNPLRWLSILTPLAGVFVAIPLHIEVKDFNMFALTPAFPPIIFAHLTILAQAMIHYGWWPAYHHVIMPYYTLICLHNIALAFPNLLRQGALTFVTTYCHYFGDIPHDVFYQTQVLDHPIFWPFQLFCANFGATHLMHHFVTRQPFYLRQMTATRVLPFINQWRGNRYTKDRSAFNSLV